MKKMSQKIILKQSSAKITKETKTKKLNVIKKEFEKNLIFFSSNSSVIASINLRYVHNGKTAIPVINKIGESCFNYNQLQLIKKQNAAEFDQKLGYWFFTI